MNAPSLLRQKASDSMPRGAYPRSGGESWRAPRPTHEEGSIEPVSRRSDPARRGGRGDEGREPPKWTDELTAERGTSGIRVVLRGMWYKLCRFWCRRMGRPGLGRLIPRCSAAGWNRQHLFVMNVSGRALAWPDRQTDRQTYFLHWCSTLTRLTIHIHSLNPEMRHLETYYMQGMYMSSCY